jgi:hypothetical protein
MEGYGTFTGRYGERCVWQIGAGTFSKAGVLKFGTDVTGPWCYDDGPQMSEAIRTTETLLVSEDIIYVTRLR